MMAVSGPDDVSSEVADLAARYVDAVNDPDPVAWRSCWAPDAVWTLGDGSRHVGIDAIMNTWERALASFTTVVQVLGSGVIDTDKQSDRPRARWWFVEHADRADGRRLTMAASYEDVYVRGEDGILRFAERTLRRGVLRESDGTT